MASPTGCGIATGMAATPMTFKVAGSASESCLFLLGWVNAGARQGAPARTALKVPEFC